MRINNQTSQRSDSTLSSFPLLLALLVFPLLSSCSSVEPFPLSDSMQYSDRGFDFNKKFPPLSKSGVCPTVMVGYDTSVKRMKNIDGLYYTSLSWENYFEDLPEHPKEYLKKRRARRENAFIFSWCAYNYCDLELSDKEKRYIAAYDAREREFDRKYAGEIKRKLKEKSVLKVDRSNGRTFRWLEYPPYLVGEELPDGLVTPASYFTPYFILNHIDGFGPRSLDRFVASIVSRGNFLVVDAVYYASRGAKLRLEALYPEYVLTYYMLKSYSSPQERHQVAVDLATYYSDVAFRGAAEGLFDNRDFYLARQRSNIANYIASRVYDFIMMIDNPQQYAVFKREYKDDIVRECARLISQSFYHKQKAEKVSERVIINKEREVSQKVLSGKLRCVND